MTVYATSGSKLYVGQALAPKVTNFVAADFAAQSWVEVRFTESIGAFGDESASVRFDAIGQQRTYKLKGNRDAGDMQVVCGINYTDQGQATLRGIETTNNNYAFRVDFNDMPAGGTVPSKRYFIGLVTSAREQLDSANNVMKLNVTIAINSNIVRVNAA